MFSVDRHCVMFYQVLCYNCTHFAVIFEFVIANILRQCWKQMIITWCSTRCSEDLVMEF